MCKTASYKHPLNILDSNSLLALYWAYRHCKQYKFRNRPILYGPGPLASVLQYIFHIYRSPSGSIVGQCNEYFPMHYVHFRGWRFLAPRLSTMGLYIHNLGRAEVGCEWIRVIKRVISTNFFRWKLQF